MDALLAEVQLIKIPRPKFCCSKGQLRSTNSTDSSASTPSNGYSSPSIPQERRPSSNGHTETINNSRQVAPPRIPSGHNGTTTATNSADTTHHQNGNFYPVEPPKDYFDDDLHIEALAIRTEEDLLNRANLHRPAAGIQVTRAPGTGDTENSTAPPADTARTGLVQINGHSPTRESPGDRSDVNNKLNGN